MEIEPIGVVRNGLAEATDENWGNFPIYDAPGTPRVPEWVERLMAGYF
jgi:hypothetical protein